MVVLASSMFWEIARRKRGFCNLSDVLSVRMIKWNKRRA
jgi:hypothetical protein